MRLLDCHLQNVRLHSELQLAFSPHLTLIGGANESGKSTLVEALHRTLFLRATATGAPVQALQSRLHLGQPTVALRFEACGDIWTLRKRFSGAGGQVSLRGERSPQPLTGAVAEEHLAALLGVNEMLGARQASRVLPSRWAHLWVMQGNAGENPLAAGTTHYDFDALRQQLEQSGGAAVQESAGDQRVQARLAEVLAETFTSRGIRKHSALWQRQEQQQQASAALQQALARLNAYDQANDDLAATLKALAQAQRVELPALQEQHRSVSQGAEAAGKLQAAITLARRSLEPIRLRQEAARQALQEVDGLQHDIRQREQALDGLHQASAAASARAQTLTLTLEQRRQGRAHLQAQRQQLEQRGHLLALLSEAARSRDALSRLEAEQERQRRIAQQRQELQQQLAASAPISRRDISQLRDLSQRLRDSRTRLEAMAAGVTLLRADQPVRLNGAPLEAGAVRRLTAMAALQVGDGVELEIHPGGGQALDQLEEQARGLEVALQQRLQSLAVASLEEAEHLLEQRNLLEQRLASLEPGALGGGQPRAAVAPLDGAVLEQKRQRLQQRLGVLASQLEALQGLRLAMEQEEPLPVEAEALETQQQHLSRTLHHTTSALQAADGELDRIQESLQELLRQQGEATAALQTQQAQLQDRRSRLEGLLHSQGSRDGLQARLQALTQERDGAEADLQRLELEHAQLVAADPQGALAQLESQIEGLQRRIEQFLDQRGAAKQRCDAISATDPYAQVERSRAQLEVAEADLSSLQRLIQAQQALQDLFQEAQADLSSRYSAPLAQAIGSYLRPLVPDGPVAQIDYDANAGFRGLQLRRGPEFYAFEQLSGGMREQLAAALRLAMADVLKGGHDGCLPVLFDDAFTNSDPQRVDLVKQMLSTAVERGLQVILLTCDPKAYGGFADREVTL